MRHIRPAKPAGFECTNPPQHPSRSICRPAPADVMHVRMHVRIVRADRARIMNTASVLCIADAAALIRGASWIEARAQLPRACGDELAGACRDERVRLPWSSPCAMIAAAVPGHVAQAAPLSSPSSRLVTLSTACAVSVDRPPPIAKLAPSMPYPDRCPGSRPSARASSMTSARLNV